MARETVAQRNARYDAETEARLSKEVAEYPQRLMTVLTRAGDADFDLDVRDNKFRVTGNTDEYDDNSLHWDLAYAHSPNSQEQLERLEDELDRNAAEAAEAKRQDELARSAFNKLTKEEQQVLGLNSRFNW
jgi:hypothetical protein